MPGDYQDDRSSSFVADILTQELKEEMSAADYEAAAISAAISMEKKAIELYADRAVAAQDPNEKALYEWLAKWETQHLNFLAEIDKELTEQIWHDSNFWPF
jgi:rubrerythrin